MKKILLIPIYHEKIIYVHLLTKIIYENLLEINYLWKLMTIIIDEIYSEKLLITKLLMR